uniref:Uncharacterized protein n=1 Tax=Ditylenchus dipsaci TaxID=166011 RepID=A0A915D527_9BILA
MMSTAKIGLCQRLNRMVTSQSFTDCGAIAECDQLKKFVILVVVLHIFRQGVL